MMWLCRTVEILSYILNKPKSTIMINNPVWRLAQGIGLFPRDQCIKDNGLYSDGMLRSNSQYSLEIVNIFELIIFITSLYA